MSDLEVLSELTTAENDYKKKVSDAETKATKIVAQARSDAELIKKKGLDDYKKSKDERTKLFEGKVKKEREERYNKGVAELDKQHPVDNPNTIKAVEWLLESFEGWLTLKGG